MQKSDLVVVPLKTRSQIAIGEVISPYSPTFDGGVSRQIKWIKSDLQRDVFRQDLLFSFGAFMTVCEISRNDALRRAEQIISSGKDPGFETGIKTVTKSAGTANTEIEFENAAVDLAQIARDQIERRLASAFTGHDFTRLIAAILTAQGYSVHVAPAGPDKGIDTVAGQGILGLDNPRLVAQVKSGNFVTDQPTLQSLIGAVHDAQADHGLLVSWNGFTKAVEARRNELYFRVRLWGRKEIINALFDIYDKLPEDLRAELPLQRIYTLVLDEEIPSS